MNTLHRIDDQVWACRFPRDDSVPALNGEGVDSDIEARICGDRYEIVHIAASIIAMLGLKQVSAQNTQFHVPGVRTLTGRWQINIKPPESGMMHRLQQWLPFSRRLKDRDVLEITVEEQTDSFFSRVREIFRKATKDVALLAISEFDICKSHREAFRGDTLLGERLTQDPFGDAFTKVAADAFRSWEPHWVPRSTVSSKSQLTLRDGMVLLELNKGTPDSYEQEQQNRKTVVAYKKFVLEEYGHTFLNYLQHRYSFDLDTLIKNGDPLLPEHVWYINIGVNNLEQQNLEVLYKKLQEMQVEARNANPSITVDKFYADYLDNENLQVISVRALRGLTRQLPRKSGEGLPTVKHLRDFLDGILLENANTTADLGQEAFNRVVDILKTPREFYDNIFTGRKITHLPVAGYYTMADRETFKPALDQQEALQVFPDIEQSSDWNNFYEILSHVLVKKHLIRRHPDEKWRVGALISAPPDSEGNARWYRVVSCSDDNRGDFNFTLVPACRNDTLPHIKLYRSTASDKYNMNGWTSVNADLLPFWGPGGTMSVHAEKYQLPFFHERTIPVWVGYLLTGKQKVEELNRRQETTGDVRECFARAVDDSNEWRELLTELAKGMKPLLKSLIKSYDEAIEKQLPITKDGVKRQDIPYQRRELARQLRLVKDEALAANYIPEVVSDHSIGKLGKQTAHLQRRVSSYLSTLEEYADKLKELPENKIACDITYVGQSLGGALAQRGLARFGPYHNRIPLPGHNFLCYTSHSPAVSTSIADKFINFGVKHRSLLKEFGQRWKIYHQMEYGDPVALGGFLHIGATGRDSRDFEDWLDIKIQLFKPLDTATTKEVVYGPTHGRRIGVAKEGVDYSITQLTPAGLHRFDSSFILDREQRKLWGFRIANSPIGVELARRFFGLIRLPYSHTIAKLSPIVAPERGSEIRDKFNVLYTAYNH